jgi:hypothetical protein
MHDLNERGRMGVIFLFLPRAFTMNIVYSIPMNRIKYHRIHY